MNGRWKKPSNDRTSLHFIYKKNIFLLKINTHFLEHLRPHRFI